MYFNTQQLYVASEESLDDWTTELGDPEETQPKKQERVEKLNDFGEDVDVDNAINRSSIRVGLPVQCVGVYQRIIMND